MQGRLWIGCLMNPNNEIHLQWILFLAVRAPCTSVYLNWVVCRACVSLRLIRLIKTNKFRLTASQVILIEMYRMSRHINVCHPVDERYSAHRFLSHQTYVCDWLDKIRYKVELNGIEWTLLLAELRQNWIHKWMPYGHGRCRRVLLAHYTSLQFFAVSKCRTLLHRTWFISSLQKQ